jgi:hypothetical protein
VWVFVDYNNGAGKMERLLLSSAKLTASSWPAASVTFGKDGNNKGAWVVGNAKTTASGSFSATVQLLTATADLAGVCVYASNYPPVGEYITPTQLAFTGTPNYNLVLTHANGSTYSGMSDGTFDVPPGDTLKTFTDKTGAPGTFYCIPPVAPTVAKGEFCYEQSGVLVATASGSAAIVWYDAPSAGNLLHTGNMLSLTPYNNTAQYYAQAALSENCRSERTKADYTVSNCTISGDCPNYTAGNVGTDTAPAACTAHYAGQIGSAAISLSCMTHDAGRIGRDQ